MSGWLDRLPRRWRRFDIPALVSDLESGDLAARSRAARSLGESGDPRAVPALIAELDGPVLGAAAAALEKLADPRAVLPLIAVLRDGRGRDADRALVVEALGALGDRRAIGPLTAALEDGEWIVRHRAAPALAGLGWTPADDRQRSLRAIATGAWSEVVALGPAAVGPLIDQLAADPNAPGVATALGEIGDRRAVPTLLAALQRTTFGELPILIALGKLDPDDALERWVEALSPMRRADGSVQEAAIAALRDLRPSWDSSTIQALLSWLESDASGPAAIAARILEGTDSPDLAARLSEYHARIRGRQDASLDELLPELVAIGAKEGFLSAGAKRNARARAIGAELDRQGGMYLMRRAHAAVSASLGRIAARELEAAWDGVGDWLG